MITLIAGMAAFTVGVVGAFLVPWENLATKARGLFGSGENKGVHHDDACRAA